MVKNTNIKWSFIITTITMVTYLFTWRFYAVLWIILAVVDFMVVLIYTISLLVSVILFIRNIRNQNHPYVGVLMHLVAALVIITAPSIYRNRNYPKGAYPLNNGNNKTCPCNLYIDAYCVYGGGAWGGDLDAIYLTDNKIFRVYLGERDEIDEHIVIKCNGDQITTVKTTSRGISTYWTNLIVLERKSFSLKELINGHSFQQ